MGKSTISMAIFNSYVSLPEGRYLLGLGIWVIPTAFFGKSGDKTGSRSQQLTPIRTASGHIYHQWSSHHQGLPQAT